jgi:carbonic anhydrase
VSNAFPSARPSGHEPEPKRSSVSSSIDKLLENSAAYAAQFGGPSTQVPAKAVAIVTCMDTRIDGFRIFGLGPGDAHIVRNAGGLVTDDVLRSLVISQRLLGTREVMLVHHTKCGLHGLDNAALRAKIADDVGRPPPYELGAFGDLDDAVRAAITRVRSHPFLLNRDRVRGFVYDVDTGRLREVVV